MVIAATWAPTDTSRPPAPQGTFAWEYWTPEMAFDVLARSNNHNRKLDATWVGKYTDDMREGRFRGDNGETIGIDENGNLRNGQHRLTAIVESEVSQWLAVLRNLPADVPYDIGRKRDLGQQLALEGVAGAPTLVAAARIVHAYEVNGTTVPHSNNPNKASDPKLREYIETRHPGIVTSYRQVTISVGRVSRSTFVAMHYLFSYVDEDDADEFMEKVRSGAGLAEGDPIHTLRERLLREKFDPERAHRKLPTEALHSFVIRSFNAWRAGERRTRLTWGPDQAFPAIVGCKLPTWRD